MRKASMRTCISCGAPNLASATRCYRCEVAMRDECVVEPRSGAATKAAVGLMCAQAMFSLLWVSGVTPFGVPTAGADLLNFTPLGLITSSWPTSAVEALGFAITLWIIWGLVHFDQRAARAAMIGYGASLLYQLIAGAYHRVGLPPGALAVVGRHGLEMLPRQTIALIGVRALDILLLVCLALTELERG